MNERWVICRKEKNCKRCQELIKIGNECWKYGSAYYPCFMCKSCKTKEDLLKEVENKDKEMKFIEKFNLTKKEFEQYEQNSTSSMVENRWRRLEHAIYQQNNPNSPFYKKQVERIKQIIIELENLGIPKKIIMGRLVEIYEKERPKIKNNNIQV